MNSIFKGQAIGTVDNTDTVVQMKPLEINRTVVRMTSASMVVRSEDTNFSNSRLIENSSDTVSD